MEKLISAETEEEWKELKRFADMFEEEVSFRTRVFSNDVSIKLSKALPPLGMKVIIEGEIWRNITGIICKKGKICDITDSGLFGVLSDDSDFFLPQFKLKVVEVNE